MAKPEARALAALNQGLYNAKSQASKETSQTEQRHPITVTTDNAVLLKGYPEKKGYRGCCFLPLMPQDP